MLTSKKLQSAGFSEQQAEALAQAQADLIDERLATKDDVGLLRKEMREIESNLKRDMHEIESSLKHDIKELEMRMTIRLGTLMVVAVGVMATLVKLL